MWIQTQKGNLGIHLMVMEKRNSKKRNLGIHHMGMEKRESKKRNLGIHPMGMEKRDSKKRNLQYSLCGVLTNHPISQAAKGNLQYQSHKRQKEIFNTPACKGAVVLGCGCGSGLGRTSKGTLGKANRSRTEICGRGLVAGVEAAAEAEAEADNGASSVRSTDTRLRLDCMLYIKNQEHTIREDD